MFIRFFSVVLCCTFVAAPASAFVIDGNLEDWGVTVADGNKSTYDFLGDINLLASMVDDQNDYALWFGYLGPNRGGQNYDAEMLAVAKAGD